MAATVQGSTRLELLNHRESGDIPGAVPQACMAQLMPVLLQSKPRDMGASMAPRFCRVRSPAQAMRRGWNSCGPHHHVCLLLMVSYTAWCAMQQCPRAAPSLHLCTASARYGQVGWSNADCCQPLQQFGMQNGCTLHGNPRPLQLRVVVLKLPQLPIACQATAGQAALAQLPSAVASLGAVRCPAVCLVWFVQVTSGCCYRTSSYVQSTPGTPASGR